MNAWEKEPQFLSRISSYLLSLPFDLKVLQEAASDLDLEHRTRAVAVGVILHTLGPQEGESGPLRYIDDVLLVRVALWIIAERGGEASAAFRARFVEIFESLADDIALFSTYLGPIWQWLTGKAEGLERQVYRGRRADQYVDDEDALAFLYEQGLEFQTNYSVTEQQVRNKIRRGEQLIELLDRRRAEEAKKIS